MRGNYARFPGLSRKWIDQKPNCFQIWKMKSKVRVNGAQNQMILRHIGLFHVKTSLGSGIAVSRTSYTCWLCKEEGRAGTNGGMVLKLPKNGSQIAPSKKRGNHSPGAPEERGHPHDREGKLMSAGQICIIAAAIFGLNACAGRGHIAPSPPLATDASRTPQPGVTSPPPAT